MGVQADAITEAKDTLTASVFDAIEGADYGEESSEHERLQRAVSRIAFALVAPTLGAFRPTSGGGFQRTTGPASEERTFLSVSEVRQVAADLREHATADLARLRQEVAEANTADTLEPAVPVWYA
ncbi:MAG: hypothetical protein AAF791_02845 [Bacteroidota bacterium]